MTALHLLSLFHYGHYSKIRLAICYLAWLFKNYHRLTMHTNEFFSFRILHYVKYCQSDMQSLEVAVETYCTYNYYLKCFIFPIIFHLTSSNCSLIVTVIVICHFSVSVKRREIFQLLVLFTYF